MLANSEYNDLEGVVIIIVPSSDSILVETEKNNNFSSMDICSRTSEHTIMENLQLSLSLE